MLCSGCVQAVIADALTLISPVLSASSSAGRGLPKVMAAISTPVEGAGSEGVGVRARCREADGCCNALGREWKGLKLLPQVVAAISTPPEGGDMQGQQGGGWGGGSD